MTWETLSLPVVFVGSTVLSFVAIVAAWEAFCLLWAMRSVLAARSRLVSLRSSEEFSISTFSRLAAVRRQRAELYEARSWKKTSPARLRTSRALARGEMVYAKDFAYPDEAVAAISYAIKPESWTPVYLRR